LEAGQGNGQPGGCPDDERGEVAPHDCEAVRARVEGVPKPARKVFERKHAEREWLGNEIAALMGPLVRSLRGALLTCPGELGLAPNEAQALWVLAIRGSVATKDLARALDIDPANASTMITKLERRRLVCRDAASHDRRKLLISLTEEGRDLRRRLARCVAERPPQLPRADNRRARNLPGPPPPGGKRALGGLIPCPAGGWGRARRPDPEAD
jgi:MarR family transcriptional regulator, organic hydroperoxide resistance regulator